PLDVSAPRHAVVRVADGRPGRSRTRLHALDAVEPGTQQAVAPGRVEVEAPGPKRRRDDRIHRTVPSTRSAAPLRLHALRPRPEAVAPARGRGSTGRPGGQPPRTGDRDARRSLRPLSAKLARERAASDDALRTTVDTL